MNKIVYLMCKYAGMNIRAIIPKGSTAWMRMIDTGRKALNRLANPIKTMEKDVGSRLNTRTSLGPQLAPSSVVPQGWNIRKVDDFLYERDINSGLKGLFPNKFRKAVARDLAYGGRKPHYVPMQDKRLNSSINRQIQDARGADAVKYLMETGVDGNRRRYIRSIPVSLHNDPYNGAYHFVDSGKQSAGYVRVGDGAYSSPHRLGHELGHALYETKRLPYNVNRGIVSVENGAYGAGLGYDSRTSRLLKDISNNPGLQQQMRTAMADNPNLYSEFSRLSDIYETNPSKANEILSSIGKNPRYSAALQASMRTNPVKYEKFRATLDPFVNPVSARFDTPAQAEAVFRVLQEIGANQQYQQVMRRALSGNPELYNRFRNNSYNTLLPNLATYIRAYEPQLREAIPNLPPSLRGAATEYMKLYDSYKDKIAKHYAKRGVEETTAFQLAPRLMSRIAGKRDPRLYDDLYNYAVQHGMQPDPNAWYNKPWNPNGSALSTVARFGDQSFRGMRNVGDILDTPTDIVLRKHRV